MAFMLDTDVCIRIIRRKTEKVLERLQKLRPEQVCISAITLSELEYGVARSSAPERNRLALAEFVSPIEVRPYDDQVAPYYGQVRTRLEQRGRQIGPLDTMIAAHALALGMTLVTGNLREFRRVPGLAVENWAR